MKLLQSPADINFFHRQPVCELEIKIKIKTFKEDTKIPLFYEDGDLKFNHTKYKYKEYCISVNNIINHSVQVILCEKDPEQKIEGITTEVNLVNDTIAEEEFQFEEDDWSSPEIRRSWRIYLLVCNVASLIFLIFLYPAMAARITRIRQPIFSFLIRLHIVSLGLFYFFLILAQLIDIDPEDLNNTNPCFCEFLGYILLYTYVFSIACQNCICFNIYRGFSRIQISNYGAIRRRSPGFFQYVKHSAWAFISPSLFILILVIIQYCLPDKIWLIPIAKPDIGKERCLISHDAVLYLHGKTGLNLAANMIILARITWNLYVGIWKSTHDSISNKQPCKRNMLIKLYNVSGLSWILEILTYFYKLIQGESLIVNLVSDTIILSQGVFLFICLYFDEKTKNKLALYFSSHCNCSNSKEKMNQAKLDLAEQAELKFWRERNSQSISISNNEVEVEQAAGETEEKDAKTKKIFKDKASNGMREIKIITVIPIKSRYRKYNVNVTTKK